MKKKPKKKRFIRAVSLAHTVIHRNSHSDQVRSEVR